MADQPAKKKRIVKNPETFRERAVKASEAGDKPTRRTRVLSPVGRLLRLVAKPFVLLGRLVARIPGVKLLRRPFRLIGLILVPKYFRNSWQELKLVKWPSRRDSRRLTFAVIIFATVFGALIAIVDYGLDKLFRNILLK
ncbi:MAG TPA: preprotein translocase subunit SecE [Candidatus Saccharimonadales bacterium]|nr:preprotein translocase subunit SecE [Candidatus Saccharimonadales bacterium]